MNISKKAPKETFRATDSATDNYYIHD